MLRWREQVKLENISKAFCQFFRDSKDPEWALIFQFSGAPTGQASSHASGKTMALKLHDDQVVASQVRRHSNQEEVSRMLGSELMIEPTLAQRHLSQSLNAFHYFCGMNNVNGYIPFLMEMLPRMREATLPLLSKIPIPNKMQIVSPHLVTGTARTFELEIAAFDVEKKDQVGLVVYLEMNSKQCLGVSFDVSDHPVYRLPSAAFAFGARFCGSSGCFGQRTFFLSANFLRNLPIPAIFGQHTGPLGQRAREAKAARRKNHGITTRCEYIFA